VGVSEWVGEGVRVEGGVEWSGGLFGGESVFIPNASMQLGMSSNLCEGIVAADEGWSVPFIVVVVP